MYVGLVPNTEFIDAEKGAAGQCNSGRLRPLSVMVRSLLCLRSGIWAELAREGVDGVIGCAVEYTRPTSAICSASKQLTSAMCMIRPEFETALTGKSP